MAKKLTDLERRLQDIGLSVAEADQDGPETLLILPDDGSGPPSPYIPGRRVQMCAFDGAEVDAAVAAGSTFDDAIARAVEKWKGDGGDGSGE